HFLSRRRRFHFLKRTIWEEIVGPAGNAGVSQRISHAIFIRQFAIIASVISKHHVHEEAGEKNNHSRKQNGKPQSGERNHSDSFTRRVIRMSRLKKLRPVAWSTEQGRQTTCRQNVGA